MITTIMIIMIITNSSPQAAQACGGGSAQGFCRSWVSRWWRRRQPMGIHQRGVQSERGAVDGGSII